MNVVISSNKKTWIAIAVLVAIEQLIKIIINHNYLNKKLPILPPILYFEPIFNRKYSWINSMLQLVEGKWIHIILVSILIVLIYLLYSFLNQRYINYTKLTTMFIFLFSGAICSLLDKVLWNGSLDYILVSGLFTFDLKDVYINVFVGLVILAMFFNSKALKQLDENKLLKDFIYYLLRRSQRNNTGRRYE